MNNPYKDFPGADGNAWTESKRKIGDLLIYDRWLNEVISADDPSEVYIVESFCTPSVTYQVPYDSTNFKLAELGDRCLVDGDDDVYRIDQILPDSVIIERNGNKRQLAKYNSPKVHDNKPRDIDFTQDNVKESNPKDTVGRKKVPITTLSFPVLAELGLAMQEGALKYGKHNYREIGVCASVYIDAITIRHIGPWAEGEDVDPGSGLSHLIKAMSGLMVLRDAQLRGKMIDDRPKGTVGWLEHLNAKAAELQARYPDPIEPYMAKGRAPDVYIPAECPQHHSGGIKGVPGCGIDSELIKKEYEITEEDFLEPSDQLPETNIEAYIKELDGPL